MCAQPYDLGVIESMLVEFVQRRAVAYQVQDLQCATCGKIKVTNMAKYCPCSGHFVNTISPQAFDTTSEGRGRKERTRMRARARTDKR